MDSLYLHVNKICQKHVFDRHGCIQIMIDTDSHFPSNSNDGLEKMSYGQNKMPQSFELF